MGEAVTTSEIARGIVDDALAGNRGVRAYVVVSSVDREIEKERARRAKPSQRSSPRRRKPVPNVGDIVGAVKGGGLVAARAVADAALGDPRCAWWCESRAECEVVIAGIYERLRQSHYPYDAFDFGVFGPLAWFLFWRDQ